MDIVEMRADHLPALLDLVNALGMYPINTPVALRMNTIEDDTSPADLRLLGVEGSRVIACCLACVRTIRGMEGEVGVVKLFGVHPDHRRRGLATALFDEIERRFGERGLATWAVEGVGPHWFFAGVELTCTPAISFLMHRGYQTDRTTRVDMKVDLATADLDTAAQEGGLLREGIVVRRARESDIEPTARLVDEFFSPGWRIEVGDAARFSPLPLYVALSGERVIAFAAYDVSGPSRFGPTGTDPAFRRRGIGGVLLKRCLRDIRDRGTPLAEIGWVGPIGFYARAVDAEVHRAYWGFRKAAE
ncbi:MAG: GNAT family N-acetyltransferase [Chloroflexi bacterium]|nr:GNAT family N-acetyltransferase [Chloroflexota bacterium]